VSRTKSELSALRGEVHEREEQLYSEISDLESRLAAVRKDAENAAKERDAVKNGLRKDERAIEAETRKEIEKARREASAEKKRLTQESWTLENRIESAKMDMGTATRDLAEANVKDAYLPSIPSLKNALMKMKQNMMSQVEELKEKQRASEMFFDKSLMKVKKDEKEELEAAKLAYEGDIAEEERKLENSTSYNDSQLEAMENELQQNIELAGKPVDSAGAAAISEARKNRIALYQDKFEAVTNMKELSADAVKKVVDSGSAIQDQYDAEYENELRNLEEQEARGKRRLKEEDEKREKRKSQLQSEMTELTRKLSLMMQDERAVAEEDFQRMKLTKTTELTESISRSNSVTNEIQNVKSNLSFVEYELKTLQLASQQRQDTLSELEEERTSFRKQARRTISVAIGRITRRGSRGKGK